MGKRILCLGLLLLTLTSCRGRTYFQVGESNQGPSSVPTASQWQSTVLLSPIGDQTSPNPAGSSVTLLPIKTDLPATVTSPVDTSPSSTPIPQTTADSKDDPIQTRLVLLEFTQTVAKGKNATVTIKGKPDTLYSIKVKYSSGYSTAKGLEDKISDVEGICSWTWRVSASTKPGSYPVTISDGVDTYVLTLVIE